MNYLDMTTVQARKQTDLPRNSSRTGYGAKLPTSHMLRIGNRWHRVYVMCWSNAGTAYVVQRGQRCLIETGALWIPQ